MAYTAFYRKWRPQTFSEVVGQKNTVQALTNQLKSGRIGHAYLFCGTRGTGKTTIAKIMARAVNCENPVDGEPCNACSTCRSILEGSSVNVVEIDAASNNGVDDIRQIREEVRYAPPQGHYRVYIIDEVHSLTANAYNALLKTLEEPPSYVIFILATTEAHKIPVTVLSRCQRYDFKRIETDYIYEHLKKLAELEKIDTEDKALKYIARAADGGMRDALSLLEQCVSCCYGEHMSYELVLSVLGAAKTAVFAELFDATLRMDVNSAMRVTAELSASGRDLTVCTADYVWFLRNLMLVQTSDITEEELGITAEELDRLKELAISAALDDILRWIMIFSEVQAQMKNSTVKRTLLEVAVIRAMKPESESSAEGLERRLSGAEERLLQLESGAVTVIRQADAADDKTVPQTEESVVVEINEDEKEELMLLQDKWSTIISNCRNGAGVFIKDSIIEQNGNQYIVYLKDKFGVMVMEKEIFKNELLAVIKKVAGRSLDLTFRVRQDYVKPEYKVKTGGKTMKWSQEIQTEN